MSNFNIDAAKKFLFERENSNKEELEKKRQSLLEKVKTILIQEFQNTPIEVFLIGSITQPYYFYAHSDVDIVVKNFKGNPFSLSCKLERKIDRNIDLILFEDCHFQDFIVTHGLKVI